ncbi:MAG: hypothetical protein NVV59_03810 [Chitinophagaceae bacterium]|nr:hypothetical protein [Chitinophagaceae bacterium]
MKYDTVFASVGSVTQSFKIINENNQKLRVSLVELAGLNNSNYTLNIDGVATPSASNIEIAANDSIYVFAQVKIDPSTADLPFIVRDSIRITYNGNEKWVQLEAWGQNAHFLRGHEVVGSETWVNDKPYVILDYLYVAENSTLTLQQGCRLYMHANAPIFVDGTLEVNGAVDSIDRVYFLGDRLDLPYRNYPASWPGIFFRVTSSNNVMNYAVIRNAYQGIIVEGMQAGPNPKLTLDACILDNIYDVGIWAVSTSITARNCLISNCGRNMVIEGGGNYNVTHSTLATYSSTYIDHKDPVLSISDVYAGVAGALSAQFVNNIIWAEGGLVENEVVTYKSPINNNFSVIFDHNLWKVTTAPANVTASGIINNQSPAFENIDINRRSYNFRLKESSPRVRPVRQQQSLRI